MSARIHLLFYYIGIAIIFLSHIYMLTMSTMTTKVIRVHAIVNILAALFIAYYFMNREGFIKF